VGSTGEPRLDRLTAQVAAQERRGKRPLQEWLDHYQRRRSIAGIEHLDNILAVMVCDVERLLTEGRATRG
jgi:hypothetical protein